jgi:hypothetical protein
VLAGWLAGLAIYVVCIGQFQSFVVVLASKHRICIYCYYVMQSCRAFQNRDAPADWRSDAAKWGVTELFVTTKLVVTSYEARSYGMGPEQSDSYM